MVRTRTLQLNFKEDNIIDTFYVRSKLTVNKINQMVNKQLNRFLDMDITYIEMCNLLKFRLSDFSTGHAISPTFKAFNFVIDFEDN